MNSNATDADLGAVEQGVDPVEQLGAVGQPGQLVVRRRPAQLLGRAQLLGDVLDVGDRERHALVLGDRDAGARPDVLAVAAQVALVEEVRVDDAELEAGPVGGGGAQVVGVGDLADAATDEVVDRPLQHLGERTVGVDDPRVVETHERHPGGRRMERLLEAPPRLLERAHVVPHARSRPAGARSRSPPRPSRPARGVGGHAIASTAIVEASTRASRSVIGSGDTSSTSPWDSHTSSSTRSSASTSSASGRPTSSPTGSPGELGHLGVDATHDALVVDGEHRLGQVVEQQAQLALGVDEALDRAVEMTGDAPRLEPAHRHGAQREPARRGEHDHRRLPARLLVAGAEHGGDKHDERDQQAGGDHHRCHPPPRRGTAADDDAVGQVVAHAHDRTG